MKFFESLDPANLKNLIEMLTTALGAGFSTTGSPLWPALEAAMDLVLSLSKKFKSGTKAQQDLNPEVTEEQYQENEPFNWAGMNSHKIIKTDIPSRILKSARISRDFMDIAEWIAQLRTGNLQGLSEFLVQKHPKKISLVADSAIKEVDATAKTKQERANSIKKKQSSYFYRQRIQTKSRKQPKRFQL